MNIYDGQTLTIIAYTGIDLSGCSAVKLGYTKPDGTTGYWTGAVTGTGNKSITYTDEISGVGEWTVWARGEWATGAIAIGAIYNFTVLAEGA